MVNFEELVVSSDTQENLQDFIDINIHKIYEYFRGISHVKLSEKINDIDEYTLSKIRIFRKLDFNKGSTKDFITILLEVNERLCSFLSFDKLYKILQNEGIEIPARLQAAALFNSVRKIDDYQNRLGAILDLLKHARLNEEDNSYNVSRTLLNYYSNVIYNFGNANLTKVNKFKISLSNALQEEEYYALNTDVVQTVLQIEIFSSKNRDDVQKVLDNSLPQQAKHIAQSGYLIEQGTEYSSAINGMKSILEIRRFCSKEYTKIKDDSIFYSLNRGVAILTEEAQMFAYMFSFGRMHEEKLKSALESFPDFSNIETFTLLDWGCGQGIGAMSFIENVSFQKSSLKNLVLIEPSQLALKRASLHLNLYIPANNLRTINKEIDSLCNSDFHSIGSDVNVHVMSNILDVELFSITQMVDLIKENFTGLNYFVIVSPYVNRLRTSRIEHFCNSFDTIATYSHTTNRKGEWINGWSRITRLFSSQII